MQTFVRKPYGADKSLCFKMTIITETRVVIEDSLISIHLCPFKEDEILKM